MSNRNNHPVNPANNNGGSASANGGKKEEKVSIIGKVRKIRDRIMANKFGRIAVRGLKVVGVGAIGFASYKAGAKSVKPTTIYIREGVTEEEPKTEEPVPEEEPAENEDQG